MDQEALVKAAAALISGLEANGTPVRGAMWIHMTETNGWRLWVVGKKDVDKKEFYAAVASQLPSIEKEYPDFSISDVELKPDTDPSIQALAQFIKAEGLHSVSMSRVMVDGIYTPEGVLLRMAL